MDILSTPARTHARAHARTHARTHPLPELLVGRDGDGRLLLPFGEGEGVDLLEELGHAAHELLLIDDEGMGGAIGVRLGLDVGSRVQASRGSRVLHPCLRMEVDWLKLHTT